MGRPVPAKIVTKRSVRVVGRGLASYPLAPPRPEEKKAQAGAGPRLLRIPTYQLSNMASPDVVCQPCGSALGAPTKECSTAHKTLFLPRNGSRGAPTSDTRGRNGADRAAVSILLQPRNRCRAASRQHDRRGTRRSRNFSHAVGTPHRDNTTGRGRGGRACPKARRSSKFPA